VVARVAKESMGASWTKAAEVSSRTLTNTWLRRVLKDQVRFYVVEFLAGPR